MRQSAAKTSLEIKIITLLYLLGTAAFLAASAFDRWALVPGAFMVLVGVLCYLLAPVSYEVSGGRLTVFSRGRRKEFSPVVGCSLVRQRLPLTIRLFGIGGLFAGVGIFWNRTYRVFRAYVTSSRHADLVLVQTETRKILISPEDPKTFVEPCGDPNKVMGPA
ncbi:MAG: PH domain-containing protein [Planctomycetota bacterium]|nr:PH domain-containing protein [Planctomycetota bacterium]